MEIPDARVARYGLVQQYMEINLLLVHGITQYSRSR